MVPWILLGLAAFLAIVWTWEYLDERRKKAQKQGK